MFNRIKAIIKKEFRQIIRDIRSLSVLIFIPAFMLFMFGYALSLDVKHISLAVLDLDRSKTSREFIDSFCHSEYFDFNYYLKDNSEIDKLMNTGDINAAISIPPDFSKKIKSGRPAKIQVIIDGTNSNNATISSGYINVITQNFSNKILIQYYGQTKKNIILPIDFRPRIWFNPELKSAKILVTGLIAFILTIATVISTSLSIVKEIEHNTIEQIIVSPLRPIELIIGKTIPYTIISIIATILILITGYYLFDVAVKGSYIWLSVVILIFIVCCLGLGLFISAISDSQQVAFMIAIIMTMLPTFLLSGFVFPINNMPKIIQYVTHIIPAKYFLVILKSIILKGVGISAYWEQIVWLTIFSVIIISISSVWLNKKLKQKS